ncbi:MAG: DNRLRE domain-containing protein, partial [Dehalococcoidia bacterium]|nr:DNRLRE domain-containing protein [Dehalococcoidia bacterium]
MGTGTAVRLIRRWCAVAVAVGPLLIAAGGISSSSTTAGATGAPDSQVVLRPVADGYVNSSLPTANFATRSALRVDGLPLLRAYLRFEVPVLGGAVDEVALRVFANSSNPFGLDIYTVGSAEETGWQEASLTYQIAPEPGRRVGGNFGHPSSTFIEVDLSEALSGLGPGSLDLVLATRSTRAVSYGSRESGVTAPSLVLNGANLTLDPPGPPAGLAAEGSPGGIRLSWSGPPEASGYNVYRSVAAVEDFVRVNELLVTDSQFVDVGAPAGQNVSYMVAAVNEAGVESIPVVATADRPDTVISVPTTDAVVATTGLVDPGGPSPQLLGRGPSGSSAYWHFDLNGLGSRVTGALLRLYVLSGIGEIVVRVVPQEQGSAASIDNLPPASQASVRTSVQAGGWVVIDVSSLVFNRATTIALSAAGGDLLIGNPRVPDTVPQLIVSTDGAGGGTPSPAPVGLAAIGGQDGVELTWDSAPSDGLAGFLVYRSHAQQGPFRLIASEL